MTLTTSHPFRSEAHTPCSPSWLPRGVMAMACQDDASSNKCIRLAQTPQPSFDSADGLNKGDATMNAISAFIHHNHLHH